MLAVTQRAISSGELNASIEYVLCTRKWGEAEGSDLFLSQAESYGLPTLSLSLRDYRQRRDEEPQWRERYNRDLLSLAQQRPADALVFAGFMLIVSEDIINTIPALNLHPAAPGGPTGTWQDVIWELIRTGATESGALVQLSTAEVDTGPTIAYCRFPIHGPHFDSLWQEIAGQSVDELRNAYGETHSLFAKIRQEGLRREALTLVAALRQIADGQIRIADSNVRNADGSPLLSGVDITEEIESVLATNS